MHGNFILPTAKPESSKVTLDFSMSLILLPPNNYQFLCIHYVLDISNISPFLSVLSDHIHSY